VSKQRGLRWFRSGDVWLALDEYGWKRYIIWYEIQWHVVGPVGMSIPSLKETQDGNLRRLKTRLNREWRSLT